MPYVQREDELIVGIFANKQSFAEEYLPDDDSEVIAFKDPVEPHISTYHKQRVTDGITVSGVSIKANDKTERRLMAARIVAKENAAYTVKWEAENGFFELNATQIIAIADALLAHIQKCFAAKEAIASEEYLTKEEVEQAFDAAYDSL